MIYRIVFRLVFSAILLTGVVLSDSIRGELIFGSLLFVNGALASRDANQDAL